MKGKITPASVYVADTGTDKGRGVFAARDFKRGELVEACPVLVLYHPFERLTPSIRRIVYNWGELTQRRESSAVVYGYGSLYNHDNPANMRYHALADLDVLQYLAVRDIARGEELTVNYNATCGAPISEQDNWFTMQGIIPI